MMYYDRTWLKASVAEHRKRVALSGTFDGTAETERYLERCSAYHAGTGTVLLYTRDVGYHTSGWLKNPDYERCLHLSLSFNDPTTREPAPRDRALTREWLGLFFGANTTKLWCEPPYSPEGKAHATWHYRLFCAPDWSPILPRGEVYTRKFTPAGWKSFSEVQAEQAEVKA